MFTGLKRKALGLFWPAGSKARILKGPLKGRQFIISDNSGWSPIVGRWEPDAQQLFMKVIRAGWIVYDLGANNGIHSLLLSQLVGNSGKVYSFEPLPTNCEEIRRNAELNSIDNITIVQKAVSNCSGESVFHLGLHDKQGSLVGLHDKQGSLVGIGLESGNDIKVSITTLDEFIDSGHPYPDFIKIDIEGAESLALQGFTRRIDEKRPILFIELHNPEQDKKVGAFLLEKGYSAYRMTGNTKFNELGLTGLQPIADLTKNHPHPDGIWGTILAIHASRLTALASKQ